MVCKQTTLCFFNCLKVTANLLYIKYKSSISAYSRERETDVKSMIEQNLLKINNSFLVVFELFEDKMHQHIFKRCFDLYVH